MKNNVLIKGVLLPNVIALIVFAAVKIISAYNENATVIVSSLFIVLPVVMGIVSAYYWKNLGLKTVQRLKHSVSTLLIALALTGFFMSEGYICLLIVSPLIFCFLITGIFIGKYIFEKRNNKMYFSTASLLLFFLLVDIFSVHDYRRVISDEIVVFAPVEKVWKNVVAFDPIVKKPEFWMFKIGMPQPSATTVEGYYQGAGRKCIFDNGIVFDERMVVFKPGQELTFDIIGQPADPEILGHIEITRGQFILRQNADGSTTLVGNSWYRLLIFPSWYYDLWAESITRNVHMRVMDHIKMLSEKDS
jgi:hypothetical protein